MQAIHAQTAGAADLVEFFLSVRSYTEALCEPLEIEDYIPQPIVEQINREVTRIMNLPDIREQLRVQALVHRANTPQEFDRFVRSEVETLRKVIQIAGIKAE